MEWKPEAFRVDLEMSEMTEHIGMQKSMIPACLTVQTEQIVADMLYFDI
jgi:hypothetical protein